MSFSHSAGSHQTTKKPVRRLRPEIAAAVIARKRMEQLDELYRKPIDSLEPDELARMKAAFFRS